MFDLPDATIPALQTPAPVRFVPEYDNLLIAYRDRNRILPDERHKQVFLSAGRVLNSILVDGFIAGTWQIKTRKRGATLNITPFDTLTDDVRVQLIDEGKRLLHFVVDDASGYSINFET